MSSSSPIPIRTRDEVEIERLMTTIQAKYDQITEMTLAFEDLKLEIRHFEREYNAHVGQFYVELDKADLETKEYRLRLRLMREGVSDAEVEMRVEACFRAERQRLEEYEQETDKAEEDSEPTQPKNVLPKEQVKQLRKLYLKLAKTHHPDKASRVEEQNKRKQLMTLINRAYEDQDLQTLERMHVAEIAEDAGMEETPRERKQRLMQEINRLMRVIGELRLELNQTKSSRIYQLKQEVETAREEGIDLLAELAKGLQRKINASRRKLADLVGVFHRLGHKFTERIKHTTP